MHSFHTNTFDPSFCTLTDPGKQFDLVADHIRRLRCIPGHADSPVTIYIERNLGFEAEHHQRALAGLPNTRFYMDQEANRLGVYTTNEIKHGMARLVVLMLEEHRLHVLKPIVSNTPQKILIEFRHQLEIYSYQFKSADTTFQKDQVAISGKVGGMKDDICIAFQLGCYLTQLVRQRDAALHKRARLE